MKRKDRDKLKKVKDPANNPHTETPQNKHQDVTADGSVRVGTLTKIDLVQDLKYEYKASNKATDAHNRKQLLFSKITAGLLFLTAGLAGWQGISNWTAAKAAKDAVVIANETLQFSQNQFRLDQRPYIIPEPHGGRSDPKTNSTIVFLPVDKTVYAGVAIGLRNGGKSPAIEFVNTRTKYFLGPSQTAIEQARSYVPHYDESHKDSFVSGGTSIVAPSDEVALSATDYARLEDGSWKFFVVGGARYTDTFSPTIPPYETTYCYEIGTVGIPFHNCDFGKGYFGNSIK